MKIKEIEKLKEYVKYSTTFTDLYLQTLDVDLFTIEYAEELEASGEELPGGIYLPKEYFNSWNPDEVVTLSHEMRHAIQDHDLFESGIGCEFDAFDYQGRVRREFIYHKLTLTEESEVPPQEEIEEVYRMYYNGNEN